jgi:gas vesicle protein
MEDNTNSYTRGFVVGALIGGAVGAITALLLAPKTGKELRGDIAEKSGEYYVKASDYFTKVESDLGIKVSEMVNEGKEKAQTIINSAKKQAGDLLENAEKILADAKVKAGSAKETISNKYDTIKDATKAGAEAFKTEYNAH